MLLIAQLAVCSCTGEDETCPLTPDATPSCGATLPAEPCASGQMALVGETSCRELAPCGDGPWGDIPIGVDTQFVDGSYVGGSDGTETRPWQTIAEAVAAASAGATVAVASGRYEGSVILERPIALWGRCPSMVEIDAGDASSAVRIQETAAGAEVHTIALTAGGLSSQAAGSALVDRVWIHDATSGIYGDPASSGRLEVRGSLIERIDSHGISIYDVSLSVEGTVIRDVAPSPAGIPILALAPGGTAQVAVVDCVLERGAGIGLLIQGAAAEVSGTLVRDMVQSSNALYGDGIVLLGSDTDMSGSADGSLQITGSFLCHNERAGIANFGAAVTLESVRFDCNAVDINGEPDAYHFGYDPVFDNLGGNRCGCGCEDLPCQILSTGLAPPGL